MHSSPLRKWFCLHSLALCVHLTSALSNHRNELARIDIQNTGDVSAGPDLVPTSTEENKLLMRREKGEGLISEKRVEKQKREETSLRERGEEKRPLMRRAKASYISQNEQIPIRSTKDVHGSLVQQHATAAPSEMSAPEANESNMTLKEVIVEGPCESHVGAAIGLTLLGTVAFFMTLFYGVNVSDKDIIQVTWKVTSEVSATFCAVLLFSAMKDVIEFYAGSGDKDPDELHGDPGKKVVICSFVYLLVLWLLVQVILVFKRRNAVHLHAWGMIGGVMIAFCAIDAFGEIQQMEPFRENPFFSFLALLIAAALWCIMCVLGSFARKIMINSLNSRSQGQRETVSGLETVQWHMTCKEAENEGAGICLGLLASVIFRFIITGRLPSIDGDAKYKSQQEILEFSGVCVGLFVPVLATTILVNSVEKYHVTMPYLVRAVEVLNETVSMTWGWCFVFLSRWIFWSSDAVKQLGIETKMTARMSCAILGSACGFATILLVDFVADRMEAAGSEAAHIASDSIIDAVILGIAIGWECAFKKAVHSVATISDDPYHRVYISFSISILLCLLIIPGWVMYMLPMAMKGEGLIGDHGEEESESRRMKRLSTKMRMMTADLEHHAGDNEILEDDAQQADVIDDVPASSSQPYMRSSQPSSSDAP